jgi:hypothetical protein
MTTYNENKLERMLAQALRKHSEAAPAGFTERMMKTIELADQQRILAAVIFQKRLALAASVGLGIAAVVAAIFFPTDVTSVFRNISSSFTKQGAALLGAIPGAVKTISNQWQFYALLAAASVFAIYSLLDMLLGDRLKVA